MKLANFQRSAIVRAIFQDVPLPDAKKVKEEIQLAVVKAMSPNCRRLYKTAPGALKTFHTYDCTHRESITLIVGDADVQEAIAPWSKAKQDYTAAKTQLTNAIQACSTVKQFNDRFPEFAKYAPKADEPIKNLPALANIVSSLVSLGWKG